MIGSESVKNSMAAGNSGTIREHHLTVSDVIELYDEESSEFYYVDHTDFKPVAFGGPEPVQCQMLQL